MIIWVGYKPQECVRGSKPQERVVNEGQKHTHIATKPHPDGCGLNSLGTSTLNFVLSNVMYLDLTAFNSLSISSPFLQGWVWHKWVWKTGVWFLLLFLHVYFLVVFLLVEFLELQFVVQTLDTSLVLLNDVIQ